MILVFTAPWCSACQKIKPILKDFDVTIVDVSVDPDKARKYNVMSLPTVLILHGDKVYSQIIGSFSKSQLKGAIDNYESNFNPNGKRRSD